MINLQKIVRPNILKLKPYSSARDEYKGSEGVFLDANENPYGEFNRYPDPQQKKLKEKISTLKKISTDCIYLGNGSDEIIDSAFRIFCRPGIDKALTFAPTYGMYDVSAEINHVELIKVPLNSSFDINLESLDAYLEDELIKLIFICSPNNPTGNSVPLTTIEYVLEKFHGIVMVDEAYIDFSEHPSLIPLIKKYNNLIVSQTFSKAWGLAGVRVGAAYMNPEILNLYNKVKPPYNISELNQREVLKALDDIDDFNQKVEVIKLEKNRLIQDLESIDFVKKIYPSDANFILIEVTDANKIYDDLILKSIIVRNRSKLIENCLRISIGTPCENNTLIKALKKLS